MSRTFFPRADCIPAKLGGYLATYRWYEESQWTQVPGGIVHPSQSAARAAAEAYMSARMNPEIRTDHVEHDPIEDEVAAWRRRKDQEAEEERAAVFGGAVPSIVFAKGGRQVTVERKRRRA